MASWIPTVRPRLACSPRRTRPEDMALDTKEAASLRAMPALLGEVALPTARGDDGAAAAVVLVIADGVTHAPPLALLDEWGYWMM